MGVENLNGSVYQEAIQEKSPPVMLVGVKVRPDGTHDYSRAMTMLGPTDVLDPGQEEAAEAKEKVPQPWLDMDRERAFEKEIVFFDRISVGGDNRQLQEFFLAIFNSSIVEQGRPALTTEEISSLRCLTVTSTGCSEISDHDIQRPIILFDNAVEFQNFYKRFTGEIGSGGFHLDGSSFDGTGVWSKTGLIITRNNKDFITHEIRHTIDPYVGERSGSNRMIEEAFGYYQEMVTDSFSGKTNALNPIDGPWAMLQSAITGQLYYERYFTDGDERPTYEEFQKIGEALVSRIRKLHKTLGSLETQRILVRSKTIEEIMG